jgi:hypothetical protein
MKSQWTRRRVYLTIRRPFMQAEKLGLIDHMPFRGISERPGGRGRDLTPLEFRTLLREATPELKRVLMFMRLTGCRPGGVKEMLWQEVNLCEQLRSW